MARIKKELTELIGGTPLLELSRLSKKHDAKAQIIAKLEYFNPGGSVKDRIALAMIEDAEAKGILKPGAVIIEPTSGNTGVGLAWVASVKGYKAILTMPETMSEERQNLLKAMGAQLVLTQTGYFVFQVLYFQWKFTSQRLDFIDFGQHCLQLEQSFQLLFYG